MTNVEIEVPTFIYAAASLLAESLGSTLEEMIVDLLKHEIIHSKDLADRFWSEQLSKLKEGPEE